MLVMFLLLGLVLNLPLTKANETSPISILTSLVGSISPGSGYYEINVGRGVNLRADAGEGYTFWFWAVGNYIYYDNPPNLTIEKGLTYMIQAIYIPTNANITNLYPTLSPTSNITLNPSPTVLEFQSLILIIAFLVAATLLGAIVIKRRQSGRR